MSQTIFPPTGLILILGFVLSYGRGKRIRRSIVHAFALLLLVPASCLGANWFVRPVAQGAATGVDWNNATTLSGIPWASIATSDTIYIAGGTYSTQNFTPTKDGASSNAPIVLQRAQAANSACTGAAGWSSAFDSQAVLSGGSYMRINHNYVSVKGMVASGILINIPSGAGNYGIGIADGTSTVTTTIYISNVELSGPGSSAPLSYGVYSSATSTANYLTLDHCKVHDVVNGMQCYGRTGMVIQYSEFYNINGGSDGSHPNRFYLGSGTFTGLVFRWNKFHDDNCLGCAYEDSGICISNVYEGNWFWNCAAVQGGITTDSDAGDAINSIYIYNNTWSNCCAGGAAVFVKKAISAGAIQNNIVFKGGGMWQVVGGGANNATVDHNFTDAAGGDGGTGTITSGSDPFVGATDFHIVSTIGATFPRDKGTSAPGSNWNTDLDGNVRGADGAWDMGAMEYPGAVADPNITTQPQATTVNCGSTASFSVVATGNTALSYQWYKTGAAVSGATQSSYTTPATVGTDNGSLWKVVVTDTAGSITSSVVALNIELIITQPQSLTVAVNQNATFTIVATTCVTSGGTYQWNRNGTSISGATQSSYTLNSCQLSDSGSTFSCNVRTVGESEGSTTATLTVTTVTNFYASPNGNSGNTGLSTGSPWDVATAIANVGNSNVINFMDGDYTPANCPGNNTITGYGVTLRAINKWMPRFRDLASDGTGGVFRNLTGGGGDGLTVDGLQFSNVQSSAILIRKVGTTNVTVRNCWPHHTCLTWTPSQNAAGIQLYAGTGYLIERNLSEFNGSPSGQLGFNHGVYLGGTNCVVRNNVLRYNHGYGAYLTSHANGPDVNCQMYNNLVYGNDSNNGAAINDQVSLSADSQFTPAWTNYFYGNTVISTGKYAVILQWETRMFTNNILISTNEGIHRFGSDPVYSDYETATNTLLFSGAHDTITTYAAIAFRNPANGLYWASSSSSFRGVALSGVYGAVDFFNNAQSIVTDSGAFQYAGNLANDTRMLDPSSSAPNGLPDYWGAPSGIPLNLSILGQVKITGNVSLK